FLTSKHPNSREEYTELLKYANDLFKKNYMNITPLTQVVINKAPVEVKALLLQAAESVPTWDQFLKRAEDVAWIAFPDKTLNCIEKCSRVATVSSETYCEWHESRSHNTKDCEFLKQLKSQYKKGNVKMYNRGRSNSYAKNVRTISGNNEDCEHCSCQPKNTPSSADDINKQFFIYSTNSKLTNNPFFLNLWSGAESFKCLVDTGADVSIIPSSIVENKTISPLTGKTRIVSACGNELDICGSLQNLQLRTEQGKEIVFSPLVVKGGPRYLILGIDVILKHYDLLSTCLNQMNTDENKRLTKSKKYVEMNSLEASLKEYEDIFTTEIAEMNLCKEGVHKIETGCNGPVYQRTYRVPIHYEAEIEKEIRKNLNLGIIRRSKSAWCSRIVPVTKPDGTLRMCIDYRPLNKITKKDRYPLPRIDEILDALAGSEFFTSLDATSGYYQIAVDERDREKTAFAWKGGLFEFNRMPFGLCNAPATFQRTMDKILGDKRGTYVLPYLDDIIIYSKNLEEHKAHVVEVMRKLKEAGVSLNQKKCKIAQREIKILGSVVSKDKIIPDPDKVKAIKEFPAPRTVRELRSFLGVTNYCREYIKEYAITLKPLFDLLKGDKKDSQRKLVWTLESTRAFKEIKTLISLGLERAQPDFTKPFILTTDASDYGIGAILSQVREDGREKMISAFSKNLDKAQLNYSVTDKELLAVVKGIENYRHYLLGAQFTLRTDHKALAYLWETKNPCSRILRWSLKLQEYSFNVEYIRGSTNIADACSRALCLNVTRLETTVELTDKQKEEVLRDYHETSGHGTANTMKFLLDGRYKWKGMINDIENYVKQCRICTMIGGERTNTKNKMILATRPNDIWELDLIGRIPTKNGNKFVFVAIDHFSKWIETKVIPNKSERTITSCIIELILKRHGTPNRIITDCGLEFKNRCVQALAKKEGIEWNFASPAHHKTVGCVERVNQTLWNKVRKLSNFGKRCWEKVVPLATYAVNISFNRAIGTSPFLMKHGRTPELKTDKMLGIPSTDVDLVRLYDRRQHNLEKYRKSITKGCIEIPTTFKIGDRVLVFKKKLSNKLLSCWTPGYVVVGMIPPDAYLVKSGNTTIRLNKSHLKLDTVQPGREVSY
ncbi:Transposon Tf2-6 polyprotein, partial [Nosema granulosis]